MLMCVCAYNYWKCVDNKCLLMHMLLSFGIYFRVFLKVILMLLLITGCNFIKKDNVAQKFSNESSKIVYQWNNTVTQFARLHKILSGKFYTNPLKFQSLFRLAPVYGYSLAVLA